MSESTCIVVVTDRSLVGDSYLKHPSPLTNNDCSSKVTIRTGTKQIWKDMSSEYINECSISKIVKKTVPMLTKIPKELSKVPSKGVFQGYVHIIKDCKRLKDQYEEQTGSKFILYSQTKNFGDGDWMEGKHRVLWEIAPNSQEGVSLPFQGIPFFVVGHTIYDCQYGRDRNFKKKQLRIKNHKVKAVSTKKRKAKHQDSKKIGCPAQILMREVIMFPEYKLAVDSHKRRQSMSQRLRWGIDLHKEGKDMLLTERRIYIYFPHANDHQNHVGGGNVDTKVSEPIDPRIIQKIHSLTCQGVTGTRKMIEHINTFIKDMFEDSIPPVSEYHHYTPCDLDIKNAMKKAQADMRRSNREALQGQCSSLMLNIRKQILTMKNDKFLEQMRSHLLNLHSFVNKEESLEPFLLCCQLQESGEQDTEPPCKRIKTQATKEEIIESNVPIPSQLALVLNGNANDIHSHQINKSIRIKEETVETLVCLPENASAQSHYPYSEPNSGNVQPNEIVYLEEMPQNPVGSADGIQQVYYYQKMPSQGEIYTLDNIK